MTTSSKQTGGGQIRQRLLAEIASDPLEKFTVSETARHLHRSEQEIYNLIYTGSLVAMNIGAKPHGRAMYRILRQKLVDFINQQPEDSL